jgi:hypothetical protein
MTTSPEEIANFVAAVIVDVNRTRPRAADAIGIALEIAAEEGALGRSGAIGARPGGLARAPTGSRAWCAPTRRSSRP